MNSTTQTNTSLQAPQKVLLLENIHEEAVRRFEQSGFVVESVPKALSEQELSDAIADVSLLGVRSKTRVTPHVLDSANALQAIGCFCIGTDQVDLTSAGQHGVAVFNAPFSNTRSVVELAIAEIIGLLRRITEKSDQLHRGVWNKSATNAHEIRGQTLGIVGYGNIGAQLSVLAEALGMHVLYYDLVDKLALGNAQRCRSLSDLLQQSDIVTLHVDGRESNRMFFGEPQFEQMKPGSYFLNLCRGFVIDHDALRRHLDSGHILGAAVDVFAREPASKDEPFESPLRGATNVILTPHIGGSTEEAQADIGRFVSGKLADFVNTGATTLSVNLPQITPPIDTGVHHRLAHLHQNVPGVLARINSILGERGVNVDAQMLATRNEFGYALTDISVNYAPDVIRELQELDATIRLRVIR